MVTREKALETRSSWKLASVAVVGAIALLIMAPAGASAADCEFNLTGAEGSLWDPHPNYGMFANARLSRLRDDAFNGYTVPEIDEVDYENPHPQDDGCGVSDRGRTLAFPADQPVPGVKVTPQLHADNSRALGRQYVTIENTTSAPVSIDFGWDGALGSRLATRVEHTSSGDSVVDTTDGWAASCRDRDDDGCEDVVNEANRSPELGHNWERDGGERDSADSIKLADGNGNFDVVFEDVQIGPGEKVAYMTLVSLAMTIADARGDAQQVGSAPSSVFADLSRAERERVRNW